jgi:hypothetical protein
MEPSGKTDLINVHLRGVMESRNSTPRVRYEAIHVMSSDGLANQDLTRKQENTLGSTRDRVPMRGKWGTLRD